MHATLALTLAIAASLLPAQAAEMTLVPAEKRHFANWDSYCDEWEFTRDKSIRFVAHGDEDGGLFLFFRRSPLGNYQALFAVHPAMTDSKRPGQVFWGYAWNIEDIVLAPDGQRAIPYVLFRGTAKQPDIKADLGLRFAPMTPVQVRRHATASLSRESTRTGKPALAGQLQQ